MIRVYTCMVADLFHPGHIAFLQTAQQLGDHLTVFVLPDALVESHKGKRPVMTQAERGRVLSACRYVDAVLFDAPLETTLDFMRQHDFNFYAFACATPEERRQKFALSHSLPQGMIRELEYTQGISTTQIIGRVRDLNKD